MVVTRKHKIVMVLLSCCLFLGFTLYEQVRTKKNVYVLSDTTSVSEETSSQNEMARGDTLLTEDAYQHLESVVEEPIKIIVHIEGEVVSPGVYQLEEGARVNDLVFMAGGLTQEADRKINLAQKLQDEAFVYVPALGEVNQEASADRLPASHSITFMPAGTAQNSSMVNINTADQKSLESLAGIGPVLAERIISYREEKGPFQQLQDLKKVTGIGDKRYQDIENDITL